MRQKMVGRLVLPRIGKRTHIVLKGNASLRWP